MDLSSLIRRFVCFFAIFFFVSLAILLGCNEKNSQQKPEIKQELEPVSTPTEQTTSGLFSRTNEDGDYWLFFIQEIEGEEEQFIYTDESILSRKDSFVGKTVKVTWKKEMFEQAGSGENFEGKLILKVDVEK